MEQLEHVTTSQITINFDFHCRRRKQKELIQILHTYADISLDHLALYLDVSINLLLSVYKGLCYLPDEAAYQLANLFLIRFGE